MGALKNHPGMWLRDDAAQAINELEAKYGVIQINSAGRTQAEQQQAIDRWNKGGAANRPPHLYKPAMPAATSPHVVDGGVAVDVYHYTSDRKKLEEFGFVWFGPGDPVHYNFRGRKNTGRGQRPGYQDGTVELQRFQQKLIQMGHDLGPTGADAKLGDFTRKATLWEQQCAERNGYPGGNVEDDGYPGPQTEAYLDWWLVGRHQKPTSRKTNKTAGELNFADIRDALNRHGYGLPVTNSWDSTASNALADFQRRNGLKPDRIVGDKTWAKLNID